MVFESIIRPLTAIKKPWQLFFFGFFTSSIGTFLGYWIFRDKADLVMIFLTVFACTPLMFHAIRHEEKIGMQLNEETRILKRHSRLIIFYVFLFLGITVSYVCWYVFLPSSISQVVFKQQIITIAQINAPVVVGNATAVGLFNKILMNNIKVMIFCLLFSFFYGAGAIFILTWNASVVAAAIGNVIKLSIAKFAAASGAAKIGALMQTIGYAFTRYFFHGLPEMLAYMIAGLAGGIISVAVINKDFKDERFQKIMLDASTLILIALAIILAAAIVETYITPALF